MDSFFARLVERRTMGRLEAVRPESLLEGRATGERTQARRPEGLEQGHELGVRATPPQALVSRGQIEAMAPLGDGRARPGADVCERAPGVVGTRIGRDDVHEVHPARHVPVRAERAYEAERLVHLLDAEIDG